MTFAKKTYIKRRKELKKQMKSGLILIAGNDLIPMNYEHNVYHFVQDSTFLYYFGINKEGYIGLIDADNDKDYLFGPSPTIDDIIWEGNLPGLNDMANNIGVENILFEDSLNEILKNRKIFYVNQYSPCSKMKLGKLLNLNPYNINENASYKLMEVITNQRNIKTAEEIKMMNEEAEIGKKMHLKALETAKAGMKEYEVEAAIRKVALENNSQLSFPSIVTINGQILHNPNYNDKLEDGKLLLVDAGSRGFHGYCSDMTSVIPVSGKFTEKQRDMYNLLIKMYNHAESILRAGITYREIHLSVCKIMAEGMIKRGLLKGNVDEIINNGVHALFMPHGLGHMIGLDVHDMESFGEELVGYGGKGKSTQFGLKSLRLGRKLEAGFCLTVEPGIYFIPELIKKWKNEGNFMEYINYDKAEEYLDFGGMRYEGDYVITKNGASLLGGYRPRTADEVEEFISGKR